ncbi:hypothetical protein BRD18_04285 [Halobacteriales archaeon SW_7_71_33]|nr:MAG: hypothetical protein BRD18_04285 [Halobacteriales archaeon SW_7_71_33]
MSAESPESGGRTRAAEFDYRAAAFTFEALERAIVQAFAADELEIAAEYVDALFLLGNLLGEFHEEYRNDCEHFADHDKEIAHEERALRDAVSAVDRWAAANEHRAAEWFQEGESA